MLCLWALASSGDPWQAERGFHDLAARLAQARDVDIPLILHVQCRHCFVRGMCGQVSESASGYDAVISGRLRTLGLDHDDVLDAGHSQGKVLVLNGAGLQAIPVLRAVADDRARLQGDNSSDTLESRKYFHLACVQAEPRDDRVLDSAIATLTEILRIQEDRHGRRYPMTRDTDAWLGLLRQVREAVRFGEAVPSLRQFSPRPAER